MLVPGGSVRSLPGRMTVASAMLIYPSYWKETPGRRIPPHHTGGFMATEYSRSLKGSVALITGAGSGMGRATALVFAAEGAHIAVTDFSGEAAQAVAAEIEGRGQSARAWAMDVADATRVRGVVGEIGAQWGVIDAVVNNAGISAFAPIDAENYDAVWTRALAVLLTGKQSVIRAALAFMRQSM